MLWARKLDSLGVCEVNQMGILSRSLQQSKTKFDISQSHCSGPKLKLWTTPVESPSNTTWEIFREMASSIASFAAKHSLTIGEAGGVCFSRDSQNRAAPTLEFSLRAASKLILHQSSGGGEPGVTPRVSRTFCKRLPKIRRARCNGEDQSVYARRGVVMDCFISSFPDSFQGNR